MDPFTGSGAYTTTTTAAGSENNSVANAYFPQKTPLLFDQQPKFEALAAKMKVFNEEVTFLT